MKPYILAVLAAVAASLMAGQAFARAVPPIRSGADPNASNVAQGLSTSGLSVHQKLATALDQIRATTCAPAILRVADFLLEGQEANFTVQPLGPDANVWPIVVVMESAHPTLGRTRFSTIVGAPGPTCSGMYEQTVFWPKPCSELKRSTFDAFKAAHVMLHDVQVSEANPALQLYLIPGSASCVSVKKELFR